MGFRIARNQCGCAPPPGARREKRAHDTAASSGKIGPAPSPHPKGAGKGNGNGKGRASSSNDNSTVKLQKALQEAKRRIARLEEDAKQGKERVSEGPRDADDNANDDLAKEIAAAQATCEALAQLDGRTRLAICGSEEAFQEKLSIAKAKLASLRDQRQEAKPISARLNTATREVAKKKKAGEQAEAKVEHQVNEITVLEEQLAQAKEELESAKEACKLAENERKEAKEKLVKLAIADASRKPPNEAREFQLNDLSKLFEGDPKAGQALELLRGKASIVQQGEPAGDVPNGDAVRNHNNDLDNAENGMEVEQSEDDIEKLAAALVGDAEGEDDEQKAKRMSDLRERITNRKKEVTGVWRTVAERARTAKNAANADK